MKYLYSKSRTSGKFAKQLSLFCVLSCTLFSTAQANPDIANVINGQVTFQQQGNTLTITNSAGAIINWQDFSIANGELTQFIQANANSAVLNRVVGGNVSQIMGELTSNGRVFLINQNGIVFSDSAVIDTQGFIASTLNISDDDFKSGILHFVGESGRIENRGLIQVTGSGDIALVSPDITNSGLIKTDNGQILLAAGREVMINSPDFSDILIKVKSPDDSAVNLGEIIANQGSIGLLGGSVNNQGNLTINQRNGRVFIEADQVASSGNIVAPGGDITILGDGIEIASGLLDVSAEGQAGDIKIGGDFQGGGDLRRALTTTVGANATIKADGQQQGNGGEVIVWSDNNTQVDGAISARGGASGGNGGLVETSSKGQLDFTRPADVSAAAGDAGTWLIDPEDINIDESRAGHIESALNQGSNVSIKTSDDGDGEGNITVNAPITKTAGGDATLSLDAHNNIDVNQPITSTSNKLHVNLKAGNAINVNQTIDTNGGDFSSTIVARMPIEDDSNSDEDIVMEETQEVEENDAGSATVASDKSDSDMVTGEVADSTDESNVSVVNQETSQSDSVQPVTSTQQMMAENTVDNATVREPIETPVIEPVVVDVASDAQQADNSIASVSTTEINTPSLGDIKLNEPSTSGIESSIDSSLTPSIKIDNNITTNGGDLTLDASVAGDVVINDNLSTSAFVSYDNQAVEVFINANTVVLDAGIDAANTLGNAGNITIEATDSISLTDSALINSDGSKAGNIRIQAQGSAEISGSITAISSIESGGSIDISAGDDLLVRNGKLNASGEQGGGRIRLGGEFQGGRLLKNDELINAERLLVDRNTHIIADGLGEDAKGGEVILWSENHTVASAIISAKQHDLSNITGGGFAEISSKGKLNSTGNTKVGRGGSVLFDPKNITISSDSSFSPVPIVAPVDGASGSFTGAAVIPGRPLLIEDMDEFAEFFGDDVTINPMELEALLDGGAAVTLQANNDIFITDSISQGASTGGSSFDLTLQAGRSIILDGATISASIGSPADNNLTLIANESLTAGVLDQQRDPGDAVIELINEGSIAFSGGNVTLEVKDDVSKSNNDSFGVNIHRGSSINGNEVNITANGVKLNVDGATAVSVDAARIDSVSTTDLNVKETLNIEGEISSMDDVTINVGNGVVNGTLQLGGNNQAGRIRAVNDVEIFADQILTTNDVSITSTAGNISLAANTIELGSSGLPLSSVGSGVLVSSDAAMGYVNLSALGTLSIENQALIRSTHNLAVNADDFDLRDSSTISAQNMLSIGASHIMTESSMISTDQDLQLSANDITVVNSSILSGNRLSIVGDRDNLPGINTILIVDQLDVMIPAAGADPFSRVESDNFLEIIGEDLTIQSSSHGSAGVRVTKDSDLSTPIININLSGDLNVIADNSFDASSSSSSSIRLDSTFDPMSSLTSPDETDIGRLTISAKDLNISAQSEDAFSGIRVSDLDEARIDVDSLTIAADLGGNANIRRFSSFSGIELMPVDFAITATNDITLSSSFTDPLSLSTGLVSTRSEIDVTGNLDINAGGQISLSALDLPAEIPMLTNSQQSIIRSLAGQNIVADSLSLQSNGTSRSNIEDLTSQRIQLAGALNLSGDTGSKNGNSQVRVVGANQDITANNLNLTKRGGGSVEILNSQGNRVTSAQKIAITGTDLDGNSIVLDNVGEDFILISSERTGAASALLDQTIDAVGKIQLSTTDNSTTDRQGGVAIAGNDQDINAGSIVLESIGGGIDNRAEFLSVGSQRIITGAGGIVIDSDISLLSTDSGQVMLASFAEGASFSAIDTPSGGVQVIDSNGGDLIISSNSSGTSIIDFSSINHVFGSSQDIKVGDIQIFSDSVESGIQSEAGLQEIQAASITIQAGSGTSAIFNQFGGGQKITTTSTNQNGDGISLINSGGGGALLTSTEGGGALTEAEVIAQQGSAARIDVRQGNLRLSSPAAGFSVLYGGELDLTVAGDVIVGESDNQNGSNFIASTDTSTINVQGDVTIEAGSANTVRSSITADDTVNLIAGGDVLVRGGSGDDTLASIQADAENTINVTANSLTLQDGTGANSDALLVSANGTGNINLTLNNCDNCGSVTPNDSTSDTGLFFRSPPTPPSLQPRASEPIPPQSLAPTANSAPPSNNTPTPLAVLAALQQISPIESSSPLVALVPTDNMSVLVPLSLFDIINSIITLNERRIEIDDIDLSLVTKKKEKKLNSTSLECQADFAA